VGHVQEAQDEEGGQQVDEPIHLAELTATGSLFVLALFLAPVVGAIPAAATAPALIVVGSMMVSVVGEIAWHKTRGTSGLSPGFTGF
jgi:xanthine/uracil/vitamin C permease (AzgA family)